MAGLWAHLCRALPKLLVLVLAALLVRWSAGCGVSLQQQPKSRRSLMAEIEEWPPPPPPPPLARSFTAQKRFSRQKRPIRLEEKSLRGHDVSVVRVDLNRVDPHIDFAYATGRPLQIVEQFGKMWRRAQADIVASGTFYGVRNRQTMGTIVTGGRIRQAPDWDDRGTALVVSRAHRAKMATLRVDGRPDLDNSLFWLQAGPRLIRDGRIWYQPALEGFQDPSLFSRARRLTIGIAGRGQTLLLVAFKEFPTLWDTALVLRDLGLRDAMNLDGGPSVALALRERVLIQPATPLTHVLVLRPHTD